MSDTIRERFYGLLPALYRSRDLAAGEPLRALMAVLESEYQALEGDLQAAYDNWFVDTGDLWVVPYLADLLGIRDLDHDHRLLASQRRRVANTVAYRRRKGTTATLEHVIGDVTGWPARVVEFTRLVSTTQHVASPRPDSGRTFDLDQAPPPATADPFDNTSRTADVRHNDQARGTSWPDHGQRQALYNLDNVGLFFWRLRPYPVDRTYARRVKGAPAGCFTFDVTGRDTPLFNRPQPQHDIAQRAEAHHLPIRLTRALLAADLRTHWEAAADARGPAAGTDEASAQTVYYGPHRSLCIWQRGSVHPTSPLNIVSADLSAWSPTSGSRAWDGHHKLVAVDVELGRLMFLGDDVPATTGDVIVSYTYALPADIGGGAYTQRAGADPADDLPDGAFRITVAEAGAAGDGLSYRDLVAPDGPERPVRTLQHALSLWETYCNDCLASSDRRPVGVIKILDSGLYGGRSHGPDTADLVIRLPGRAHLSIVAADGARPTVRPSRRVAIRLEPVPNLKRRALAIRAADETATVLDRRLELRGLVIDGGHIEVEADGLLEGTAELVIRHCTVMPGGVRSDLNHEQARALRVRVQHSILGPVRLPPGASSLAITDSIVDHAGKDVAIDGPRTTLKRVTVFGQTRVDRLEEASDSILTEPLFTDQRAPGLLLRTFVSGSLPDTIRRDHAQPELAIVERAHALGIDVRELAYGEIERLRQSIRPLFTSTTYGHPGYGQLHPLCPREIRTGGLGGAEMGALHTLYQPQREESLRRILEEYLPLGREVSIHYMDEGSV